MTPSPSSNSHPPLTLGFSPCPNDCFIFDALLHGKIDTGGLSFKPVILDVEALNKKAFDKNNVIYDQKRIKHL